MRKELKSKARARLKKCYWMLLVLCLLYAILNIDYGSSFTALKTDYSESGVTEVSQFAKVFADIATGQTETETKKETDDYIKEQEAVTNQYGLVSVGHSRGVFAQLVNDFSSGKMLLTLNSAISSMLHSKSAAIAIMIVLSLLFVIFIKVFVINIFYVTTKRAFLEMRIYDAVPMNRFLYLLRLDKVKNAILGILLYDVYYFLWSLTIVGAFVKRFSYYMVPYIIAENPTIKPKQAITMSRKMMDGHKWECCKLELSFIGWTILSILTFGIVGLVYANPYKEMTKAEYYDYIRNIAKENKVENTDLLNDTFLFEKANYETLAIAYADVQAALSEADVPIKKHSGLRGFLENVFGVTYTYDQDEKDYQAVKAKKQIVKQFNMVMNGDMYPSRLFHIQKDTKIKKLSSVHYDRHYSILTVIFTFFTISIIGWLWEVSLHLISDGEFVNRGILHGPWLPIYGGGGVLILLVLNKFRTKPLAEFISAIVLCGFLEYFTSYFMEIAHDGKKWWDYTGYFLNIHGRICAEGLLVFGLGGLVIVYFLTPFLDNHFRRIPFKVAAPIAAVLVGCYTADSLYSSAHPNEGKGITSQIEAPEEVEVTYNA